MRGLQLENRHQHHQVKILVHTEIQENSAVPIHNLIVVKIVCITVRRAASTKIIV